MPLAKAGKAGGCGAQIIGVPYPQAGRPASAKETGGRGVPRPVIGGCFRPSLDDAPFA
jgi:hypothetical protein